MFSAGMLSAGGANARDRLGVFGQWAAFRDPAVPLCYAIAKPDHTQPDGGSSQPYADVATWPKRGIRGTVHFHLAQRVAPDAPVILMLDGQRFRLVANGADAWSADQTMDAAIVAALRSSGSMILSARDTAGHGFTASWPLAGAATAMDSALLGCAGLH